MLFSIDGVDGVGKSSLVENLCKRNPDWIPIKFPGFTTEGKVLRDLLLNPEYFLRAKSEFFIFLADFIQTQHQLNFDNIYIADRSYLSLLVYQVWGNDCLMVSQKRVMEACIKQFIWSSDLTIILHTDWRTAKSRCKREEFGEEGDSFEQAEDKVWQQRVEDYFNMPEYFPGRNFTIYDVTDYPAEKLAISVEKEINEYISGEKC